MKRSPANGLAVDQAAEAIVITDTKGRSSTSTRRWSGSRVFKARKRSGRTPGVLRSGKHDEAFYRGLWDTLTRGDVWTGNFINRKKERIPVRGGRTIAPLRDSSGKIVNSVAQAGRDGKGVARKAAADGPADGGGGYSRRGYRARFQQFPDGNRRIRGTPAHEDGGRRAGVA